MTMRKFILLGFITLIGLQACTSYDYARRVVEQGNLLPMSKIDRLKVGMSKREVAILMGTSLLSPMFNNSRWDYAYSIRKGNNATTIRNLRLYFNGDRLVKIEHQP